MSPLLAAPAPAPELTWTNPGVDSQDSMPLGNGDLGLNVWTEADGAVLFYIGKTDAWSEAQNTELVKLGRIRVMLSPNPFAGAADFRQTLSGENAELRVSGGGAHLRLWVDAHTNVIRGEVVSDQPVNLTVSLDPWRVESKGKVTADVVVPDEPGQLVWYHRNARQGVQAPLADRTFGGVIWGDGLVRDSLRSLRSGAPGTRQSFALAAYTAPSGPLEDWRAALDRLADTTRAADPAAAWGAHTAWWSAFWARSYIRVTGDRDAERVSDGYAWQRFITACAGRGAYPIKFNGSLFVTDNPGNTRREKGNPQPIPDPFTADQRSWGGRYWFQNTRPMYWPRLAAGDFDLMMPFFRMYLGMLEANVADVRKHYGHAGAYFQETSPFWGGLPKITPEEPGFYTKHYYLPVLELATMALDYHAYTGDDAFARDFLLPIADAGLTFYAEHFARGTDGKLRLEPVNSIEMYWKVADPLPDLAAFRVLLPGLLALPDKLISAEQRARWRQLVAEIPEIPIGEKQGRRVLLPYTGEQTAPGKNTEVPELYAVYPFSLYGVGRPGLDLALAAWELRGVKRAKCWHQDPVWAASLGLADAAKKDVVSNLTNRDPRLRFPAFWEKGHDYAPDQDNGGNGELALQRMLLQNDGRRLLLLPAWPAGWNADFKLRAPLDTTVEGRVENGRLLSLSVTPDSRRADVVVITPSTLSSTP
ncbi:MAG: hypothetical protein H7067_10710 [Burkholderiales bacterium]|nr:hypothetical protein [Opitutaceae bacterium]